MAADSSAYIAGMDGTLQVQCCIAGGGPAGMMLGYLLGRAGVKTVVLEKHADFLRDFRGDTVHPSTLMIMQELGLIDDFLKLPHSEIRAFAAEIGEARRENRGLRTSCDAVQVRRPDAAMGFSQFSGRQGSALSRLAGHHVGAGDAA